MADCSWGQATPELKEYHDHEWGKPQHDPQKLFELLCLETYQAGLSWQTVLKKRASFREDFLQFDPELVAQMTESDLQKLMQDPRIIRNRLKLTDTVINARAFLTIEQTEGFDHYLWQFVEGQPIINRPIVESEIPAQSPLSQLISKDLKKRGFKFVGPTIIYSYLQGAGLIDDHLVGCSAKSAINN